MAGSVLKQSSIKELKQLQAKLTSALGETLGSLIARDLVARPGELKAIDAEGLMAAMAGPHALVRGALDKGCAGKHLCALFEVRDAIAMTGMLMMTPDHLIQERRSKDLLEGEDAEAFGELGNVLCAGLGNVLRDTVNVDLRLLDHGLVKPSLDDQNLLSAEPMICLEMQLQVGNYPATVARLLIDRETAELWNQQPVELAGVTAAPDGSAAAAPTGAEAPSRFEEDSLDDIPPAPVRGVLNAFLANSDPFRTVRRCCRRVGFELRRYGRSEIPNPAAHRNEVVVLDVPLGEERRFDWCRRIKDFNANIKTVLLLHRPSRARVTQAFLSQADVILGWPCPEAQLSQKLAELLGDAPAAG